MIRRRRCCLIHTLDSPEPDDEDEQPKKKKKRTSKGRQPRVFPEFLPREEQRLYLNPEDIPEEMRDNPDVRRFFKKVGETLEMIPMQLKVVEQFQEVIALDRPDETTTMVAAKRPVPLIQSFAGPSLWAYLTVSRFADHLPYYRLEDILGRSGFRIDRSTQWRWMRGLGHGVTPLVDLMWERARQSAVLGMDETPVMELGGPGRTLKGYLWAGVGDADHPYDCFFYTSDRRSIRAETMLAGFQGYLTADAYVAYERIGKLWPGVFKASCWVHGRRKFEACHHLGTTKQTHTALAYFRQLFDIEDRYRQSSDEVRLAARREQSQPIVEDFHEWLQAERLRQLPKSKLAGAINYMLNRWESFTRFLESGAVPHGQQRGGTRAEVSDSGTQGLALLWQPDGRRDGREVVHVDQDLQSSSDRSVGLSAGHLCTVADDVAGRVAVTASGPLDRGSSSTSHSTTRAGSARPRSACARRTRGATAAARGIGIGIRNGRRSSWSRAKSTSSCCRTNGPRYSELTSTWATRYRLNWRPTPRVPTSKRSSSAGPMFTFWPAT